MHGKYRLSTTENKQFLTDFRHNGALFVYGSPFESESRTTNRPATERPSKYSMQKSLHGECGCFIIKLVGNRRLHCKQCHRQTVYSCKI